MTAWTKKKEAEFKRLDRKVLNGKATRREIERAFDLKRERAEARKASA
jgi:hypothetical protein